MKITIIFSIFLCCVSFVKASLHPDMGPPHILDPDGGLMDDGWQAPSYESWSRYTLFVPSQAYKDLQALFNKITKELSQNPDLKRRQFLEKMLSATEQGLMHLYLRDRARHAQQNKKTDRYAAVDSKTKSTQPFNRATDKSGAVVWAHRHGILGQGVDVWALEEYGTLEKEGLPTPRLASVIKSTEPPLLRTSFYDVRVEGVHHGIEVTGVLYQIAPRATIHVIGNSLFSAVFDPKHPGYDKKANPFPPRDIILNWSGAKGASHVSVDYQIGHIRGFFETRSGYGDLLVKAIPNLGAGYNPSAEKRRDRTWMKENSYLVDETDPAFMAHILQHYGPHIILAGNLGPYGSKGSIFSKDDELQALAEKRLLYAWGEDVLVPFDPIGVKSGTSISAPIIAGAAALLKSKYPHLTCAEAGDILLESAQKTFWLPTFDRRFVYDPEDFEEESPEELGASFATLFGEAFVAPSEKMRVPAKVKPEPFSATIYGRGLLNLRRAFVYADVKAQHPGLTAEQLKPLFKAALRAQEDQAARTIQKAFRAYREKRK